MISHNLLQLQKKQQTFEVTIEPTLLSTLKLSVDETMELLRVSGAGIVLLQHEKLRMVVASDEALSKIEPSQFYTQQTIKQNRINEIMMPFGCHQGGLKEDKFSQQIYYYHGIPIRSQDGHCIWCLFVINNKHCSLSALERKTFSLLHRALQLTISMHAQQQITTRFLQTHS